VIVLEEKPVKKLTPPKKKAATRVIITPFSRFDLKFLNDSVAIRNTPTSITKIIPI
jgi:hypothetical protein